MLSSVLNTSLSGISAAMVGIRSTANNLANAQTDGFKSSHVVLADQRPQTSTAEIPGQIGLGVQVAELATDFSQGQIVLSGNPLDLAIEGNALFVLEGSGGERLFSRDGHFSLNANGDLVSHSGMRVLGFNVDDNLQLDTGRLEPINLSRARSASGSSLTGIAIGRDGMIRGDFSDGVPRNLGQVRLAEFANPNGLQQHGQNTFSASHNSGLPNYSNAGTSRIVGGAYESSNTEMAHELVNLTRYSTMFRANVHVAQTSSALLEELLNLTRSS